MNTCMFTLTTTNTHTHTDKIDHTLTTYPADWITATHCCMACLTGWCVVYNQSRTPPRDL